MAIAKETEFTEAIETTETDQQLQIPNELPVLPLRDIVIYPFMIVPLFVSREKSIRAVDEALGENRMILLASHNDSRRPLFSGNCGCHYAHVEVARRPHSDSGPGTRSCKDRIS